MVVAQVRKKKVRARKPKTNAIKTVNNKAVAFLKKIENDTTYYNFGFGYFKNGTLAPIKFTGPCHAKLYNFRDYRALYTLTPPPDKVCLPEQFRAFITWLAQRSPWKNVPYPTEPELAWTKGFVITDMNLPANLVGNFCIATRIPCEHPTVVTRWHEFVSAGINENLALIFASCLRAGSHNNDDYTDKPDKLLWKRSPGHYPLDVFDADVSYVENFCLGRVVQPNHPLLTSPQYTPCNTVWGETYGGAYRKFLKKTYDFGEALKSKRLFAIPDPDDNDYSQDRKMRVPNERWIEIIKAEQERIFNNGQRDAVAA